MSEAKKITIGVLGGWHRSLLCPRYDARRQGRRAGHTPAADPRATARAGSAGTGTSPTSTPRGRTTPDRAQDR